MAPHNSPTDAFDALERAVGHAIQTARDHSPGVGGAQREVLHELALTELEAAGYDSAELEALVAREITRRV